MIARPTLTSGAYAAHRFSVSSGWGNGLAATSGIGPGRAVDGVEAAGRAYVVPGAGGVTARGGVGAEPGRDDSAGEGASPG